MTYFSSLGRGLGALLLLAASPLAALAQTTPGVGIGTPTPHASAALEVQSTTKGLLPPRLSQAQRDAIQSPAAGLTIYNTSTRKLNTWNGTSWDAALSTTEQPLGSTGTFVFTYTGAPQTFTVPADTYSITVDAWGAQGGEGYTAEFGEKINGGAGARVQATLAVTPGQVLTLYVGGMPDISTYTSAYDASCPGGYNGGGTGHAVSGSWSGAGGGASDVRTGAGTLADRVLVAGGGGGATCNQDAIMTYTVDYPWTIPGGEGGAPNGMDGYSASTLPQYTHGKGATQTSGYALGQGENGTLGSQAGGGGGYYGGYASNYRNPSNGGGGGGGGSSWVTPTGSSNVRMTTGTNTKNMVGYFLQMAEIRLTLNQTFAAPVLDGSNFVNVPGTWQVSGPDVYRAGGHVGIGTATPTSTLQVAGSVAAPIRTLDSGTIAATDYTVIVIGSVSLPAPGATNTGRIYHLLNGNTSSNTVTGTFRDAGSGGTVGSFTLNSTAGGKGLTVQSDGSQWWILTRE